jgi:hypothetical protein
MDEPPDTSCQRVYKQGQSMTQTDKGVQEYNADDSSESMMVLFCGATEIVFIRLLVGSGTIPPNMYVKKKKFLFVFPAACYRSDLLRTAFGLLGL